MWNEHFVRKSIVKDLRKANKRGNFQSVAYILYVCDFWLWLWRKSSRCARYCMHLWLLHTLPRSSKLCAFHLHTQKTAQELYCNGFYSFSFCFLIPCSIFCARFIVHSRLLTCILWGCMDLYGPGGPG